MPKFNAENWEKQPEVKATDVEPSIVVEATMEYNAETGETLIHIPRITTDVVLATKKGNPMVRVRFDKGAPIHVRRVSDGREFSREMIPFGNQISFSIK